MKVSVKQIPVRYDGKSYRAGDTLNIKEKYFDSNIFEEVESEDGDFKELSKSKLKKVNNDDLKSYLDNKGIEYTSEDTKDQLIALIKSESNGRGDNNFDLADLSLEDLQEINNESLEAYLKSKEIDFPEDATKEDLIALIKHQEPQEPQEPKGDNDGQE
ncbi:hypothetical protein [Virgibacillus doumboii]|uniref:hypothetical protein n=1 Tax=Virgibacillus doumboii TaxID=2697503 RepID=UPI0013DFA039|nr:hypothetical protein [Virgibacillus doumboii]